VKVDAGYKKDYLTSAQARKVLASVDRSSESGARDYAILCLMLTTGLRTISVINANIEDLRTLGDITVLYYQGKGHTEKAEFVKIEQPVETAIRSYLQLRATRGAQDPLFASAAHRNGGERMTTRSISRIAKNALKAAGLDSDRLTAHSMRHTFATQALLNGANVQEVQQALGHKSITTTMIYAHNIEKAKNTSSAKVSAVLFE
jgi:integrase/recombinase XerC